MQNLTVLADLKALTKAFKKNEPRNYGTCIGIKNNKACITDGFGLLQLTHPHIIDMDGTYDKDLKLSQVKFPEWEYVIPNPEGSLKVNEFYLSLLMESYKPTKRDGRLLIEVDANGNPSLKSSELVPEGGFNPNILHRYMKALPKGTKMTSAFVAGDHPVMVVNFVHDTKDYLLLVTSVRK